MALKDLLRPAPPPPTPAGERPPGITCEKYTRGEGKRCVHYVANGACALPDEFMCVDWLKANGPKPVADAQRSLLVVEAPKPTPQPQARDLFGNPVALPEEPPKPKPTVAAAPVASKAAAEPTIDVDQLRGFTTGDIESFKALGVEVRLHSETYGELWLVPAYTGKPRKEITPEHAATVMRVLSVFPGSRVVAFEKTKNPERRERPAEERS
jgi:pyruvate/2-oxoglutarate dehydrogenase complex dihydrolipoamide acyltransferase (E2) component